MTPRSVDPFSSPDEAKIATRFAAIGQDEYIFPLSNLSVIACLRLVRTGEMLLEARFFIGKLQAKAAATGELLWLSTDQLDSVSSTPTSSKPRDCKETIS